jgi:hypothetical protein
MIAHDRIDNLPRMTFRLYEGTVAVGDKFDAQGRKIEKTFAPSTPVAKGDNVTLYTSSTTTTPIAQAAIADDDTLLGVVLDSPVMGDATLAASGVPTVANMRKATVGVYAVAVRNLLSDGTGAMNAGSQVGHSSVTPNRFEAGTPIVKGNSGNVSLEYVPAAVSPFAAALGFFGTMINTA